MCLLVVYYHLQPRHTLVRRHVIVTIIYTPCCLLIAQFRLALKVRSIQDGRVAPAGAVFAKALVKSCTFSAFSLYRYTAYSR